VDYDNARYYDPATGMFLSADDVQGDAQGMNPYAYVAGNPETYVDPSGQMITNNEVEVVDGVGPTNGSGVDLGELVTVLSAIGLAIQAHTPHAPHNPRFGNYGQHPSPGSSSSSSAPTVPSTDPCATLCSLSPSTNPSEGEGDSGFGNAIADAAVAAADAITDAIADTGGSGNQPPRKPPVSTGFPAPGADESGDGVSNDTPSLTPSDWRGSSLNNAPQQTTPGTPTLNGIHVNDLGEPEPYTACYDEYGRQTGRTDYTEGNDVDGTPPIHSHAYTYDHPDFPQGLGLPPDFDHAPGEFTPTLWALFWLL
jgi:hypothetical protein